MSEEIRFTEDMLKRFKEARDGAVEAKKESFIFDGHEFLVAYAKYMIEYLEGKLSR